MTAGYDFIPTILPPAPFKRGFVPTVPPEKLAETRATVLAKFHDSGHGPVPVLGPFARDLATGTVVSVAGRPNWTRRGR